MAWTREDKIEELNRWNTLVANSQRRILFCDIDGCLNSGIYYECYKLRDNKDDSEAWDEYHKKQEAKTRAEQRCSDNPCEPHISALNLLAEKVPGLEIVISSTWRHEMDQFGWDRFFATLGINIPVTGKTDRFGGYRGPEIFSYMIDQRSQAIYSNHGKCSGNTQPVVGFAVLDDDYDYIFDWLKPHWYLVKNEVGFVESDVDKLADMLLKPIKWPQELERLGYLID